jgi:hypothetical protein
LLSLLSSLLVVVGCCWLLLVVVVVDPARGKCSHHLRKVVLFYARWQCVGLVEPASLQGTRQGGDLGCSGDKRVFGA